MNIINESRLDRLLSLFVFYAIKLVKALLKDEANLIQVLLKSL